MPPVPDPKVPEAAEPAEAIWLIASTSPVQRALGGALFASAAGGALDPHRLPAEPPAGAAVLLPDRSRPDLAAAEEVADWVRASGLRHLLLVSSAEIHEPSHRHAGFLAEDRLRTRQPTNAIARGWLDLEQRIASRLEGSSTRLTILRPTALPVPGGYDLWSRLVRGPIAILSAGFDPAVQWLAIADLVRAIRGLLSAPLGTGAEPRIFHVTPRGVEPLRKTLRRLGVWALPLPTVLLRAVKRLTGRRADEADYLRFPWTVSGRALDDFLEPANQRVNQTLAPPANASDRCPASALDGHDPFGMDRGYIDRLGRTLFRFLHDCYWRIEWRGLEHLPTEGPAILTGVHRGHQPWDGVMVLHQLARSLGRLPRFLIHPALVKHPFLAPYMIRCGGLHACRENGDWVLDNQGLLAIFPEGIKGAFAHYEDAYRLRRFGRHDFVKFALRKRVPIVPFVIVGSAEIFPIVGEIHWKWWKRASGWPFLPITPTLSLVPLPSKWHVLFLEPLPVHREHGPEAADDPRVVRAISDEVKARMDLAIRSLLDRRKNIFFGSIFDQPGWAPPAFTGAGGELTNPAPILPIPSPSRRGGPTEVLPEPARRAAL